MKIPKEIKIKPIGHVENSFHTTAPAEEIRAVESRIVLDPHLADGLHGYEPGEQMIVLFCFHLSEGYNLRQHPRGDCTRPKLGVFKLRSPYRPTPIGMSVVTIVSIEGNILRVRDLDAINGSPVLDLKPV